MVKRNVHATGIALALTLTILNIVCLALLLIAPGFALGLFGSFMHGIDVSKIAITPTLGLSPLLGLVVTLIGGYVIGILFAALYNKFE